MPSKVKDYGTFALAAGGAGLGGYVAGKSFDAGRNPPPRSAIMSFAVLAPLAIGALAFVLIRKKNPDAAFGALAGGAGGAVWGFLQFPTTPAGIAAEVQNVINAARSTFQANQSLLPGNGQGAGYGAPSAGGATPSAAFQGATGSTQGGYLGRSIGASIPKTPFNRFSPGFTPRIAGSIRMKTSAQIRKTARMASIVPANLQNGVSAFPTDAWSPRN